MLLADDTNKASTPSRSKSAEPIASHTQNDKIGAKHKGGKSGGLKGDYSAGVKVGDEILELYANSKYK